MSETSRVLDSVRGGLVVLEADRLLQQVVTACQQSGKKGTLTITMTIEPSGAENREMQVTVKLGHKAPPAPGLQDSSTFFAQRGQLLRDDPEAKAPTGPVGVVTSSGHTAERTSPYASSATA